MAGFNLFKFLAGGDEKPAPEKTAAPRPAPAPRPQRSFSPTASAPRPRGGAVPAPTPQRPFSLAAPAPRPGGGAPQPRTEQWAQYVSQRPRDEGNFFDRVFRNLDKAASTGTQQLGNFLTSSPKGGVIKGALGIDQDKPSVVNDNGNLIPTNGSELFNARLEEAAKPAPIDYGDALGTNSLTSVRELTWDEYDALSPRARAAVDANTALLGAVRADTQAALKTADQSDDSYTSGIEALFGKEGGSDTYAPNTLKALQDLGLSNTETGDIDQYLNGGALLRYDELESLNPTPIPVENGMNVAGDMSPRIQNALALGDKALASMASKLQSGENPLSGLTYDDPAVSELEQLFDSLALRENQRLFQEDPAKAGEVIGLFLQANPSIDQNTFARYFEDRINRYDYSRAAGDQAASLGNGAPELYIDPSGLRSLIYQKGGQ